MTYVDTVKGVCPNCEERYPGHVYRHPDAGVCGWTCPNCEETFEPSEVPRFEANQ